MKGGNGEEDKRERKKEKEERKREERKGGGRKEEGREIKRRKEGQYRMFKHTGIKCTIKFALNSFSEYHAHTHTYLKKLISRCGQQIHSPRELGQIMQH